MINASTLSGTGVTQVAISFIEECKNLPNHFFYILISKQVNSQLDITQFPNNFSFYVIPVHPRFLFKGYQTRKFLRSLEMELKPDCVFSVFGPSYWTPNAVHLMGYAYPNYVYPDSPFFAIIPIKEKIKNMIYKKLHAFFLKKNGKYYVAETSDVSRRLVDYLNVPMENIYTVSNTFNHYFENFKLANNNILPLKDQNEFRFLSLCSFAVHKNLEILNKVIPLLNSKLNGKSVKFVLTVDQELLDAQFSDECKASIINLGRINVAECPQLYKECDALFLPTLLECFTANYPEAMKMERPILTSNLPFATEVCNKAALYCNPLDQVEIVEKMICLIEDENLRKSLVNEGKKQLETFSTSSERAKAYISICQKISNVYE
jgi:glycosyltransferase involved in cell wall biosynthesis